MRTFKSRNKLELDLIDFAKLPLGGAEGFLEVIFDENIGRTDKLSRSCETTDAGLSYGIGIVVVGQKLLVMKSYEAPKIGICDFRPFSEAYHAEILGGRKKRTPL